MYEYLEQTELIARSKFNALGFEQGLLYATLVFYQLSLTYSNL
jgi:hypothetical protein